MQYYLSDTARKNMVVFEAPRRGDAGYDIRTSQRVVIDAGGQALAPTGLHLAIPDGYVGLVRDRSSWASQRVHTHGGVIDSSYRGELMVILENASDTPLLIQAGVRIAQLVVVPCYTEPAVMVAEIDGLGHTERGKDGFGSTGD